MNDTPTEAAAPIVATPKVPLRVRLASRVTLIVAMLALGALGCYEMRVEHLEDALDLQRQENDDLRDANDELRKQNDLLREQVETLKHVEPAVPPTNDKLFTILSKGIGVSEWVLKTDDVGTTPEAAFATDLTSAQQNDAYTQEILIQNTHGSQNLCVKPIAWSGVTTCTARCAASGYTCSAAATDGWRLVAGQAMEYRFDGTNCVCVVGSGATTNYQSVRAIR